MLGNGKQQGTGCCNDPIILGAVQVSLWHVVYRRMKGWWGQEMIYWLPPGFDTSSVTVTQEEFDALHSCRELVVVIEGEVDQHVG